MGSGRVAWGVAAMLAAGSAMPGGVVAATKADAGAAPASTASAASAASGAAPAPPAGAGSGTLPAPGYEERLRRCQAHPVRAVRDECLRQLRRDFPRG